MKNILDIPSLHTIENLKAVKDDLELKIPSKKLEKNLLIATRFKFKVKSKLISKHYKKLLK